MTSLFLCVNPYVSLQPYRFTGTNINVFSVEESLYHVYHYWEKSIDEFVSDKFIAWAANLSKPFGDCLRDITRLKTARERIMAFLSLYGYFGCEELENVNRQLTEWENETNHKQFKEHGDRYARLNFPEKAAELYKKSAETGETPELLNNLGVVYMKMNKYALAEDMFQRASELYPTSNQRYTILLNMAEAAIHNNSFEKALKALKTADSSVNSHRAMYLLGEINFRTGNFFYALDSFKNAVKAQPEPRYYLRLIDVYAKLKMFPLALETLDNSGIKGKAYFKKKAWIYEQSCNITDAATTVKQALIQHKDDAELWTLMAKYYRLDYSLVLANSAAFKALSLAPSYLPAKLEQAKTKKATGNIMEYQQLLSEILAVLKQKYYEKCDR